uniref:Uncharacterized protein n=1 Tax=Anguilla anguilla TaxID=7936 RepID=A0A0E9WDJ8_ANGAN
MQNKFVLDMHYMHVNQEALEKWLRACTYCQSGFECKKSYGHNVRMLVAVCACAGCT